MQPEPDTGADKDVHILFSRGHRWKRLRSTISPSFSKSKMKLVSCNASLCLACFAYQALRLMCFCFSSQMLPLIKTCIDETMNILEKKSSEGEAFDIHR